MPPVTFDQYSGYVEVDSELGKNLFYWHVTSQSDTPSSDPLLLWLNGGPGSSSIGYGFFTEHGPFRVASDGETLELYNFSWNRDANIVYVESPAGVGFSYSENETGLSTNDQVTAANMYTFIDKFLTELYPEYLNNSFYIVGESCKDYILLLRLKCAYNNNDSARFRSRRWSLRAHYGMGDLQESTLLDF